MNHMTKKPDRRIQRTRQLLQESIISLILDKGYRKITVQDIIDRANVGRSTFYSHFRDKEDLLISSFEELALDLHRHIPPATSNDLNQEHLIHSLAFFAHAHNNREVYMALIESGGSDKLLQLTQEYIQDHIKAHLDQFPTIDKEIPLPVITNFLAGSLLTMIIWWLEQKIPYTSQEMDVMFNALAMPGIRSMMYQSKASGK